ncbi:hypothetical protein JCM8547_001501 [Rhodosporidiobolus lusitaniae]
MKFTSSFLIAALPLLAAAAPTWSDSFSSSSSKHDDASNWQDDSHHGGSNWLIGDGPFDFTSTYSAWATPDQVVNADNTAVPGEEGAWGSFQYGINVHEEIICYNITVYVSGNYSSPAATATHIHEAAYGRNGPPRIAFPNPTINSPVDEFGRRVSVGCLVGPFTTGLAPNGTDTGLNFTLSQIEANPPGFFTDTHTANFTAGAIRGQLELQNTIYK